MAAPAKTPRGANVATPGIEDGGGDEKPRGCLLMDFSKVRADIELPYICLRNILACVCMDAQNRFGDKTAFALARALENDTWLIGLNLSGNFINETGAQHLLRSLHDNSSLVELKLDGNPGITPVTLAVRIERFSSNLAARGVCYDSVCVSCAARRVAMGHQHLAAALWEASVAVRMERAIRHCRTSGALRTQSDPSAVCGTA